MSSFLSFGETSKEQISVKLLGGKAKALIQLFQNGFLVPNGFVITTEFFSQFLEQENILSYKLDKVLKKMDEYSLKGKVAVRSSATTEDSDRQSFAGQYDSFLGVEKEDLEKSIKKCWGSLHNPRACKYASENSDNREMAVIVQEMVYPQISGVAFSADPVSNNPNQIIIEAVAGPNKLLVDGSVTPDYYLIDKQFSILDRPKNNQNLSDKQIITVASLISKIERFFDYAVDVEWAMDKDSIYILQSRPITTLK